MSSETTDPTPPENNPELFVLDASGDGRSRRSESVSSTATSWVRSGRRPLTLQTRLMLSIIGVLLTALAAGLIWSHEALQLVLAEHDEKLLQRKASELRAAAVDPDTGSFETLLDELQRESEVFESEGVTVAVRREGRVLVVPVSTIGDWLSDLQTAASTDLPRFVRSPDGHPFRVHRINVTVPGEPAYQIDIALDGSRTHGLLQRFDRQLLAGAVVLLTIAIAGAVGLSRRALRPVADGIHVARQLDPDDLSARLPVSGAGDEPDQLNATINDLLDRITATHERMTRFTSAASHELRGPLASMRSLIDVTLQHNRATDEYREAIGSLGETCDRMTSLVNALLTLARADSGRADVRMETVDLNDIVADMGEFYRPLAEDNGQTLDVDTPDGGVFISGDAGLLRQLISNLLSNAFRFTPQGGQVTMSVWQNHNAAHVAVRDTGPGIPESDLTTIFDRFYQADSSRRPTGAGLGLSICRWIVTAHGGIITARNNPEGGCTLETRLPQAL